MVNWGILWLNANITVNHPHKFMSKKKLKEDVEKNIVLLTVDMIMDEETSHWLEGDSKVHCQVRGVREDNGILV